jgi:primosomal protein N' (replication factor Y) (superfamily II helicase)
MFIQVKLLDGFNKPLTYKVPESWEIKPKIGSIVSVPLRNTVRLAFVQEIIQKSVNDKFIIKELLKIEDFPGDKFYLEFINFLSSLYQIDSTNFLKRVSRFIKEDSKKILINNFDIKSVKVELTIDQQQVVDYVKLNFNRYSPVLIHGVTCSGKTEIYKKIIELNYARLKTTILLLPEVTLAIKFEEILKKTMADKLLIYSFHSSTSAAEKRALWRSLLNNEPILIIGVHLPVLLPISNLGSIIVDEEHEKGYQEKKHPKINSKEAAILRALINKIPIVLGSATPSFSSLYNVQNKGWKFFQLKKRFSGKLPKMQIVELISSKKKRENFWISDELRDGIKNRLEKKEQIIIFINRRGYSFFVQCKSCGYIFTCENCSISLTLHDDEKLKCHYCGEQKFLCKECPNCKSCDFLKKGIGTQQVVSILKNIFPDAQIARADMDTTLKKESWKSIINNFEKGDIDILVGTQTLTKGYHFPNVTLVGVLWADLNLNMPTYNASEICLQQLIQVAGRAGRGLKDSLVIVQVMNKIKISEFMNEVDYLKFYEYESKNRKLIGYPPFIRFAEIELKNSNQDILNKDANLIFDRLMSISNKSVEVLGPVEPPVAKIKNYYIKKIFFKSKDLNLIINLFEQLHKKDIVSSIYFTPNPL